MVGAMVGVGVGILSGVVVGVVVGVGVGIVRVIMEMGLIVFVVGDNVSFFLDSRWVVVMSATGGLTRVGVVVVAIVFIFGRK